MFLTKRNYLQNPARTIVLKKLTLCAQTIDLALSGQILDQNHWLPCTKLKLSKSTETSPNPPNSNSCFSASFWCKLMSRYTRTIYRSIALRTRATIRCTIRTNHSQVLPKTEIFGRFQLHTRVWRELAYPCAGAQVVKKCEFAVVHAASAGADHFLGAESWIWWQNWKNEK